MVIQNIGNYKILRVLSSHQGKKVYLASQKDGDLIVTIKSLPIHDENQMPMTLREIQVLQRIKHPNIPPFIEAFFETINGVRYINLVLEYIEGVSIRNEILQKFHTPTEIIRVLGMMLQVLEYLHEQNIIHRDITPGNIIRRSSDGKLMLVNFANAKTYNELEGTGSISVGTVGYQAPEAIFGKAKPQSDLYSLGVVALEMLTHVSPFKLLEGVFLKWEFSVAGLDPRLVTYLKKLLSFEISDRFASATEAYKRLKELTVSANSIHEQQRVSADTTITTRQYFISKSIYQERKRRIGEAYRLWRKVIERIQNKDILPHKGGRAYLKKIAETKFDLIQAYHSQQYAIFLFPVAIANAMVNGNISKTFYDSVQYWLLENNATETERNIDDLFELCMQILLLEIEKHQIASVNRRSWLSRMFSQDEKNDEELPILQNRLQHDKTVLLRLAQQLNIPLNVDFATDSNNIDIETLSFITRRRNKFLGKQANFELGLLPQSKSNEFMVFSEKTSHINLQMHLIPAGQFRYADKVTNQNIRGKAQKQPQRPPITKLYEIRHSLWVSPLITQELWEEIAGSNPSTDIHPNFIVERISWLDAILFCNQLSERLGYEPTYQIPEQVRYWLSQEQTATIVKQISCDFKKSGFRLMTEAEWRYFYKIKDLPSNLFVRHSYQEWIWDWHLPNRSKWYLDTVCPLGGVEKVLLTKDEQLLANGTPHDLPGQRYRYVGFRICRILQ